MTDMSNVKLLVKIVWAVVACFVAGTLAFVGWNAAGLMAMGIFCLAAAAFLLAVLLLVDDGPVLGRDG